MIMMFGTTAASCRRNLLAASNRTLPLQAVTQTQTQTQTQRLFSSKDNDDENKTKKKNANLAVSLFKNPIVHQLWTARQQAKERQQESPNTDTGASSSEQSSSFEQSKLPLGKSPSDSRVEIAYPFTTDQLLLESYRNPWGQMRFGKMIEDLDALAGNIAFFHVDNSKSNNSNSSTSEHPVIVTASVDRIRLRQRPTMDSDQHLSGQVTWTGTSSMEISMQCTSADTAANGNGNGGNNGGNGQEWLQAYVTFVTLDPVTKKPTAIPPLLPQSPQEKTAFQAGAARAAAKKKRRHQRKGTSPEIDDLADALLKEAGPLLNMPSLADPHSILMQATKMQNAMIAQPQVQNLHNRIFGGFLMRRAFELAFSNAYVFGGARPLFLEVDDVSFSSPVDVGDLLVFNSRVLYTDTGRLSDYYSSTSFSLNNTHETSPDFDPDLEVPLVHIEVEAWVTEPEKASARLSNQFYFTFAIANNTKQVRRVLPSNIDQARRMAMRILTDREQDEE
jgi:acyl-coenzyme A thioesterase 9